MEQRPVIGALQPSRHSVTVERRARISKCQVTVRWKELEAAIVGPAVNVTVRCAKHGETVPVPDVPANCGHLEDGSGIQELLHLLSSGLLIGVGFEKGD